MDERKRETDEMKKVPVATKKLINCKSRYHSLTTQYN